jgi:hypothetical protein
MSTRKLVKLGVLLATLSAAGLVRRGPLVRYDQAKLATGFGVSATDQEVVEGSNVIDWEGSSMLKLITLCQVSLPGM